MSTSTRAGDLPAALLTIPQAAAMLALAPRTVWQLISRGDLPAIRFGKRATRLDRREVEKFIESARDRSGSR